MQFLLQMLRERNSAARSHTKTQRIEAFEDAHMSVLWQVLYAGDISNKTHAEACRES